MGTKLIGGTRATSWQRFFHNQTANGAVKVKRKKVCKFHMITKNTKRENDSENSIHIDLL